MLNMKRFLSLFLALIVAVGICLSAPIIIEAEAATRTQAEAVAWAKSKVGTKVGSGQCPALIVAYYEYLGYTSPGGNGKDYITNKLPDSSWTRISKTTSGFSIQPGDIVVWEYTNTTLGAEYGHVGIAGEQTSSARIIFYDQGASYGYKVQQSDWNRSYAGFWGVIRPNFGTIKKPSWAKITANTTSINANQSITFNVSSDIAASYTIGIDRNGSRILTKDIGNSFTYTCTEVGSYSAYVTAYNSAGYADSSRVSWEVKSNSISYSTITNGLYYLKNNSYGTYLAVDGGKDANGQAIDLWDKSSSCIMLSDVLSLRYIYSQEGDI